MRLNQFFREFAYSQQGNVAMIFAFSLLPLLMFVGVGIDMAQASAVGRKNQDALDAAILAVFSRPLPERRTNAWLHWPGPTPQTGGAAQCRS